MTENSSLRPPLPKHLTAITRNLSPDDPLANMVVVTKIDSSSAGQVPHDVSVASPEGTQLLWLGHYAFDYLARLCARLSVNANYSFAEVARAKVWKEQDVEPNCQYIVERMPSPVFALDSSGIKIGNIALASRKATPEDIRRNREIMREEAKIEYEKAKAEIDKNKTDILSQDHARITVNSARNGKQQYYLPLDRGSALLAARVLTALEEGGLEKDDFIDGNIVAKRIWDKMPTIERGLFLKRKSDIIMDGPSAIKKSVLEVLRRLTNVIGITRETSGERFKFEGTVCVTLHAEPAEPSQLHGLRPIFPPGTERERIQQLVGSPVPESAMADAKLLLERQLDNETPLVHSQALVLLDLITDADIKRALGLQIKEMGLECTASSALEKLRDRVRHALGDGFYDAWRNRMVAGNHATGDYGKARQVGGELPIITNTSRLVTKKWHIG